MLHTQCAARACIRRVPRATRLRVASSVVARCSDARFRSLRSRSADHWPRLRGSSADFGDRSNSDGIGARELGRRPLRPLRNDERAPVRPIQASSFERVLLRLHPGLLRGGLGRNRFRGVAKILANMIEINQVAALGAKLLLHLAHDPWRSVPDRMNAGIRAEAGPDRAFEKLSSRGFDAALDRARINRRCAPFGVRQGNLGLSPRQRLAFALVLLAGVRLYNGDHAAIRLSDDILVLARRFRKNRDHSARFEDGLGVAQSDPLDRALSYLEAIMLLQLHPHLSERLIGGKIGDRALQSPRKPRGMTFALRRNGRTLLLSNRYRGSRTAISPSFVCQRSFFYLGDASEVVDEFLVPSLRPASPPTPASPPAPNAASPR